MHWPIAWWDLADRRHDSPDAPLVKGIAQASHLLVSPGRPATERACEIESGKTDCRCDSQYDGEIAIARPTTESFHVRRNHHRRRTLRLGGRSALAHFGRRVLILERHYAIGGLNSYYRLDGRNYNVGLHAVTNFRPKGARSGPLPRLLRQLRLSWDDFSLAEQVGSKIVFPGTALDFSNDPAVLESQIAERFPKQIDGFRQLTSELLDYDAIDTPAARAAPAKWSAGGSAIRCCWKCCFARSCSTAGRIRTTSISASSAFCFAAFSWRGSPDRRPASAKF